MDFYDGIDIHRRMVGDEVRTASFHASIAETVQPGDVVLDVGAGSGILSLFAAQAGASRVFAVERAPGAVALARRLVQDNEMADRIHIIEAELQSAPELEPVDVIVSEWLGVYGIDENMLAPVLLARDRWLKPGGKMIPGDTEAWIAPVFSPAGAEAVAFQGRPYGLNLTAMAPYEGNEAVWLPEGIDKEELRAEPQRLWTHDPATTPVETALQPSAAELSFALAGPVNGLVAWFSAALPGVGRLTNHPAAPRTHWGHFVFPVVNGAAAQPSDNLEVGFHCVPSPGGGSHHIWSTRLNDGEREVHDTRRVQRPPAAPPWRIHLGESGGGAIRYPAVDPTRAR